MYIDLIKLYVEYYHKNEFFVLCSGVAIRILSILYEKFLRQGEIVPIEEINDKDRYFNAGELYKTEKYDKLRVAKAAYCLKLISVID
jgi:hypothetical protein